MIRKVAYSCAGVFVVPETTFALFPLKSRLRNERCTPSLKATVSVSSWISLFFLFLFFFLNDERDIFLASNSRRSLQATQPSGLAKATFWLLWIRIKPAQGVQRFLISQVPLWNLSSSRQDWLARSVIEMLIDGPRLAYSELTSSRLWHDEFSVRDTYTGILGKRITSDFSCLGIKTIKNHCFNVNLHNRKNKLLFIVRHQGEYTDLPNTVVASATNWALRAKHMQYPRRSLWLSVVFVPGSQLNQNIIFHRS